jgi:hypothetical protein
MFGTSTARPEFTEPTTELFMDRILDRTDCKKHGADVGEPCHVIINKNDKGILAICNTRAKRAGFNARISKSSLERNHIKHYKNKKGN